MKTKFKMLKNWWSVWGGIPVTQWMKAADLYKKKQYRQAALHYEAGLESKPEHPARVCAQLDMAYCYFKLREFNKAERTLRQVIKSDVTEREAYVRLAKLQMWIGNNLDAAIVIRRALDEFPQDADLVIQYVFAVIETGQSYLIKDAVSCLLDLDKSQLANPQLEVVRACLALSRGEHKKGRAVLATLAGKVDASFETHLYFGEVLLLEGRVCPALRHLRSALKMDSEHPRVLSLLAEIYLYPGNFYNPDYALQLATQAAQYTNWLNPSSIHILAEAFHHTGDRVSALITASKAKDVGIQKGEIYRNAQNLDKLIESLQSGTLA